MHPKIFATSHNHTILLLNTGEFDISNNSLPPD